MRRTTLAVLISSVLTVALAASLEGATTIYTDRALWLSRIQSAKTDGFALDVPTNYPTPFRSAQGITLTTVSGQAGVIQVLEDGLVDGTRGLHFREFGPGMLLTLPGQTRAAGFSFRTAVESWTVELGGATATLPDTTIGFIGFVDDCLPHRTIKFTAPPGVAQGGISIDDLSVETTTTYRSGTVDNLALPTDATQRSAALTALVPAGTWKDFDDPAFNRWVGHTFTNLPKNISRAELVIAMKPGGGASFNDAVAIGLHPSGLFARSEFIADLPESGGTWDSNPLTVFTLDLSDIISKIAADRFLDVRVQDDTAVDYIHLRVWTCPPRVVVCGLPHEPIGNARLSSDARNLVVAGIGNSGNDGVRIDLGQSGGFGFNIESIDTERSPVGAFKQWKMIGVVDGVPNQPAWTERHEVAVRNDGRVYLISMDSSPLGATMNSVEVHFEGAKVFSGTFPNGELYHFFAHHENPPLLNLTAQWDATCVVTHKPDPWPLRMANGTVIERYDTIISYAANPTKNLTFRTAVESTAANVPYSAIRDEALQMFGRPHRALGEAAFEPFGGRLTVANLGDDGADGVEIDLGKAESVDVSLDPIDAGGNAAAGSFLEVAAKGSRNGVADQPLGTLRFTKKSSDDYAVDADFSVIGSTSQRVQIFDGTTLLADIRGHTGPVGSVSAWPRKVGKLGGQLECYTSDFDSDTTFRIDAVTYRGTQLRVLAEGASGAIDYKSAFAIQAAGLNEITLNGAVAGFCPASIEIIPPVIPPGVVGSPYPATRFSSPSAFGPFTFMVTGTLPQGLALTPDGRLTGVPGEAGSFPITIGARSILGCTSTRSYVLVVTSTPRTVRAAGGTAPPGSTVNVPIELIAQGDENSLGFSVSFDPNVLAGPQATLGSGASGASLNVNTSQSGQGRLGIALALPAGQVFTAGTRQLVVISFAVSATTTATMTAIGFADQPIARAAADVNAGDLPVTYATGTVTLSAGLEADVAPRPNGSNDGTVTIADWTQVGRFAAGLDVAAPGREFQRADCAPRSTRGNGAISIADWVQAGRYAAGLDALVLASGPTAPGTLPASAAFSAKATRTLYLRGDGLSNRVAIELEAEAGENALGFSLSFDPRQWRLISTTAGRDGGAASVSMNDRERTSGRVGMVVALPAGHAWPRGRREIVVVEFSAVSGARPASGAIRFASEPIALQVVDVNAGEIAATYAEERRRSVR